MALWIDPGGVINHKLCVITTSQTNRLQGRFETRMWVRSGGRGDYLSELINLTGLHWTRPKAGTLSLSAAGQHISHHKHHKRWRGEPVRALHLSETGNLPRCGDMHMFNLLHSGSLDIYLSLWIWQNLNSSSMPVIKPDFQKVRLTHFLFKWATEMK